uniref:PSP1 C-terminal domain-containing protein n=1 Tax=Paramoeba aestuarina TaxID=180227 RepID=A0A7S4NQQ4_9EUKA
MTHYTYQPMSTTTPYFFTSDASLHPKKTVPHVLRDKTNVRSDSLRQNPLTPVHDPWKPMTPKETPTKVTKSLTDSTVLLGFKTQSAHFTSSIPVAPGEFVIVECDRGIRCGIALEILGTPGKSPVEQFRGTSRDPFEVKSQGDFPQIHGKVLRIATEKEKRSLEDLKFLEQHAMILCQEAILELNLPCDLIDCEFQFDRKKITFFFFANAPIDFRALVRELYRVFGARIWMQNVNPNVRNEGPKEDTPPGKSEYSIPMAWKTPAKVTPPKSEFPMRSEDFLRPSPTPPKISLNCVDRTHSDARLTEKAFDPQFISDILKLASEP